MKNLPDLFLGYNPWDLGSSVSTWFNLNHCSEKWELNLISEDKFKTKDGQADANS